LKTGHQKEIRQSEVKSEGVVGTYIQWLISKSDGAPNFAMRRFEVEPGGHTPKHIHTHEHEVYVLSGKGIIYFEGEEIEIEKDHFAFIPPNKEHQFRNTGNENLVFLCIVPV